MHPRLQSLPDVLLRNLGHCHRQDELARLLRHHPAVGPTMRRTHGGQLYTVALEDQGLHLGFECSNPEAAEDERLWGLHSITLHAATPAPESGWAADWPAGLDPDQVSALALAAMFDLDADESMINDHLVCGMVNGMNDAPWALLCTLDPIKRRLLTFGLIRTQSWIMSAQGASTVTR